MSRPPIDPHMHRGGPAAPFVHRSHPHRLATGPRTAAVALALATAGAAAAVAAQQVPTTGGTATGDFLATECAAGSAISCGSIPASTTCSWKWHIITVPINGFPVPVPVVYRHCESTGTIWLYKDRVRRDMDD